MSTRTLFLVAAWTVVFALPMAVTKTVVAEDVSEKPSIQMLIPGFTAYELPLTLPNLNNVRYRGDGLLYALGYNGNIWLVADSDQDGFPDSAELFFDNGGRLRGPIGMAVIPEGHVLLNDPTPAVGSQAKPDRVIGAGNPSARSPAQSTASRVPRAAGVIVASKGKVSAILDIDGDGIAEQERIIADGWQEIPPNVDTIGVAIDPVDGAIYFGLGTAAYDNAYQIDKAGQSHYSLQSERGTIQRIEPDLSKRTIVCTGVRFTIGMGFDEHGELFATDQEGATWLANGNPFDELLHIEKKIGATQRHYGFPPQHPLHLRDVFDEPSLFDYAPQHQSTCGMAFNLPRQFSLLGNDGVDSPQQAIFGPEDWRGNLFVMGESRGKLYRTELARTQQGRYIARNHLIGCLNRLTVDGCLSPSGDLILACHSGGPDWGSGPTGTGKLFALRYTDRKTPQPISVWAAAPQEVRVEFDQELDPTYLKDLTAQTEITYGEFVAAGDRFETLRPGYAAVKQQVESPRKNLPVLGVQVSADRRTLIVSTLPQVQSLPHAIKLPGLGRESKTITESKQPDAIRSIIQQPHIDLAYALNGVLATWEPDDTTQASWSGVVPHLNLDICDAMGCSDATTKRLQEILAQKGTLKLETQLDLKHLLHPSVQPGSKLDHPYPLEPIDVHFTVYGPGTLKWTVGQQSGEQAFAGHKMHSLTREFSLSDNQLPQITLLLKTGWQSHTSSSSGAAIQAGAIGIHWSRSQEGSERRELPLDRFLLPWATVKATAGVSSQPRDIPELAGGSWGRGRQVFFSDEASCAKCHRVHGRGGEIGPDLSNLIHRDYVSVLRDVKQPSFAINPDYLASTVLLNDGRILTGAIRTAADQLLIGDKDGRVHAVSRDHVEELRHSPVSIMPDAIADRLGSERMRDLLTFLLTSPPQMPVAEDPPPPRTQVEVEQILAGSLSPSTATKLRPLQLLLVAGAKDHGPGEHDYPTWLNVWGELMRGADGVTVETAMGWPTAKQLAAADTIVFYQKGIWNDERAQAIDAHLAKGGGLVYIHWAIEGGGNAADFARRIGMASNAANTQYRHGPLELSFASSTTGTSDSHPISRNFGNVHFHDESYWSLEGNLPKAAWLASGLEAGRSQPLFWTLEPDGEGSKLKGRVFVSILGHYSWTFNDPLFRILLLRGIAWSSKEPVDRFNDLVR